MEQTKKQSALIPLVAAFLLLALGLASAANADPTGTVGAEGAADGAVVVAPVTVTESVAENTVTAGTGQGTGDAATVDGSRNDNSATATVGCVGASSSGVVSGTAQVGTCAGVPTPPASTQPGPIPSAPSGGQEGDGGSSGGSGIVATTIGPDESAPAIGGTGAASVPGILNTVTSTASRQGAQQGRSAESRAAGVTAAQGSAPTAKAKRDQAKNAQQQTQQKADCATGAIAPASYRGGGLSGLGGAGIFGLVALCFAAGLAGAKISRRQPALQ